MTDDNDNDGNTPQFGLVHLRAGERLSGARIRGPYQSATFGDIGGGSTFYVTDGDEE